MEGALLLIGLLILNGLASIILLPIRKERYRGEKRDTLASAYFVTSIIDMIGKALDKPRRGRPRKFR